MENPIGILAERMQEFKKEYGYVPKKMSCHPVLFSAITAQIDKHDQSHLSFQHTALTVVADDSLGPDEFKFE